MTLMMVTELFMKTVLLGIALGWKNLNALPACAEYRLDEHWWFAINAHGEATKCSVGMDVPPHSIYYEFNGFPFGIADAHEGMCGSGGLANEDELMRVIDAKIKWLEDAEKARLM
ncbi:MAG TPA: hypothetical protein VGH83_05840 [Candidatus Acidoferrum sp.]|jgi:hypothetical protein